MTTRTVQVTFDAADPGALAGFWCAALGYRLEPPPAGFADWEAALDAWGVPPEQRNSRSAIVPAEGEQGPRLFFQQVPETKAGKNRLHLDIRAAPGLAGDERMAALRAEAERLIALGARQLQVFEPSPIDSGWIVMQDPEGNEFCLD